MLAARHNRTTPSIALLIAALAATSAPAQSLRGGQVEVGTYGSIASYDNTALGLKREFGAGGRFGIFLSRIFSIEGNGDYTLTHQTATGQAVNVARVGGTLLASTRPQAFGAIYLGAGAEQQAYRGALSFDDTGFHGVLGDRL